MSARVIGIINTAFCERRYMLAKPSVVHWYYGVHMVTRNVFDVTHQKWWCQPRFPFTG